MRIDWDDDEYETVTTSRPCTVCNGDMSKCNGGCNGSFSLGTRRREPAEVAKIKAERQRKHEDAILAEAEQIKARRA
jgi:hypothetical protein